jgi:outer membrane protein assembly factor BamB
VKGNQLFVTSVPGRKREQCVVQALDAKTGKELWRTDLGATTPGDLHDMVSRAAPTPIVDDQGVYVLFESGDLARLSPTDGRVRWSRALFREYGAYENGHGYGSSPAQSRDALFVVVDHSGPSYLLAVEKATGRTLWKTPRPSRMSWASPVVGSHANREVVIVSSNGDVRGYDARSGQELWVFAGITGNHIPSPVVDGDRIYVGAATPRGARSLPGARTAVQSNCALRMVSIDGKPSVELLWEGKGALCEYGSPALHRGLIYTVNPAGVAYAVDAETGETRYSERIDGPCWVPPIPVGDLVYFFAKNGQTTVVKAGSRFERVSTNRLWSPGAEPTADVDYTPPPRPAGREGQRGEGGSGAREGGASAGGRSSGYGALDPCVYGVAPVDGAFYIRVGTHLYCVRASAKTPATR